MPATESNPTHLFVSYAIEDGVLAKWLARKLAAQGFAVWFDQMKLLGGEPWPQDIDHAIKHRTFRMLALMSSHSVHKPNPTKERVAGMNVGRGRGVPDFVITLKLDDAALDWQTSDISYIPFNRGWAEGWRQLLAKLAAVDAPKSLVSPVAQAAGSFPRGDDLVSDSSEQVFANVIRVKAFPDKLSVFRLTSDLSSTERARLKSTWPHFRINDDALVALYPPPADFAPHVAATKEQCLWTDTETFRDVRARDIAASLITKTLGRRLLKAGCHEHPKQPGIYYLPSHFTEDGKLWFPGYWGKRTWLLIRGRVTFRRAGGRREVNFHHFAFRLRLARGLDRGFYVQLSPSLFFFDEQGHPILDASVGARRKKVAMMWFNHKWHCRVLAAQHLLVGLPHEEADEMSLDSGLLSLSANRRLNEGALVESDIVAGSDEVDAESEADLDDEEVPVNG